MNIIKFSKWHKIFLSVVLGVVFVLYLGFVFALPKLINLNDYKTVIQNIVEQSVKLKFDAQDIRLVTTPSLKAGVSIKDAALTYPDGNEIVRLNNAQVKISILPIILKTLKISDITIDTPVVNVALLSDGQLDIVDYINKNIEQSGQTPQTTTQELPVKISSSLPVVTIKNYDLLLKDKKSSNTFTLKGNNFVLDKAVVNKHLRITADGKILVNDKVNLNYDVKFASFWPAVETSQTQADKTVVLPEIDFVKELVKYDPKADIKADITAKEHKGHVDLDGYLNIDKLSIKLNGSKLPDSYFHLLSKGHETDIDSKIFVSGNEEASLKANVKTGRKTKFDINLKTDKISFSSIQNFAIALLNSLNMQNDLAAVKVTGYIKSDFNVKTDLKTFESSGSFNVADGSIAHKIIPVTINDITADIDFSNNSLNIKNAHTLINGTKVTAKGSVSSSSDTDISLTSGDINIAPIFNAFAPASAKQSFVLNSGILNIDVILKGKLSEIKPDIDVALNKFLLKTKSPMPLLSLSIPSAKLDVDPVQAVINPFDVILNSSKVTVSGSIKDYLSDMKINITADGSIKAGDISSLLPKETRAFIGTKGSIPLSAIITGNPQKIEVKAQAYPDANNYFSPVSVKKMTGKNGLVNAELLYSNDNLNISDAALYLPSKALTKDFDKNKKGAAKIAGITGTISNVSSNYPQMKLLFSVPEPVVLSHTLMPDATLSTRGDLNITNTFNAPSYKGFFSIKDINLPSILTKVQGVDLEFNDNTVSANIQNLDINKTVLNIIADASTTLGNVFVIKSMKLSSLDLNVDNLFAAMDKINALMPQSSASSASSGASNANMLPVKIANGSADIQKFTMKQIGGNLVAADVTGDFTLVNDVIKIPDLKTNVYGGTLNADVSYNVKTTALTAKLKGQKINANEIVTVFTGLKDQVQSNLDFNADVKLSGATYEQQIKSLNGKADFELKDGQLGSLGRFESFLQADNLLAQSFVKTKLGSLVNTVSPYNTGKFSFLKGNIVFKGGNSVLQQVKMSGPHMSLLLDGSINLISMDSNIQILGSLSNDVITALGPVANLSVEKFAALIPNFGTKIASAINTFNEAANKTVLESIPPLTPEQTGSKSFKVKLNGNLNKPASAFDGFKWLNTPEVIKEEQAELTQQTEVKNNINKEQIQQQVQQTKENIKDAVKNNEKVQQLKENKAVKAIGGILKLYKESKDNSQQQTTQQETQSAE